MRQRPTHEVTQLLIEWSNGDKAALDKLMPLIYAELRRMAHRYMSRERPGHTMQTTALVNEAYLRLVNHEAVHWQNRAHFFAIAAQVMRHILVDHARVEHGQSLALSRVGQKVTAMTPEDWQRIKTLLQSALEREPGQRSAFLAAACGGDESLRKEVESFIISHEQAGGFIEEPAFEVIAESLVNKQTELVGQKRGHYLGLAHIGA